ncbi:MAG: NAD(P)-dependent alcohol dehydrogenase [Deltaproteobacteria bacterium]|nr:NAD(P)-dependent alcohol dehydrogenase [Deltaproteobacteria bacterium]
MKRYELRGMNGVESLQVADAPMPTPGPGEALVRVHAVSLNYRDLLVVSGMYPGSPPLPLVPTSDGAGEVAAVGPGVDRVKVGDRVAGTFFESWVSGRLTERDMATARGGATQGMLAEYVVSHADALVRVPDHLSFGDAATLPCAAVTAWHALFEVAPLRPGETVLVLGTGGVSIFALQLAAMAGAQAIVTSSSDEKLERARGLGAATTINYKKTPDWEIAVREATGGAGVDRVIEVGGPGTFQKSLASLRVGGRLSLIGILTGFAGGVEVVPILLGSLHVDGIYVGSREMFESMNRAIARTKLSPVIDRAFAFADAPAAYEYLRSGAHFGKVVIRID